MPLAEEFAEAHADEHRRQNAASPSRIAWAESLERAFTHAAGNSGGYGRAVVSVSAEADRARFLRHVRVDADSGCWLWTGARQDMHAWRGNERNPRYAGARTNWRGHFKLGGRREYAHRAAWMLWRGDIPEGLVVRHVRGCNTLCCNPYHLRPGTAIENAADRESDAAWERELQAAAS